jgi:hypothetical protein
MISEILHALAITDVFVCNRAISHNMFRARSSTERQYGTMYYGLSTGVSLTRDLKGLAKRKLERLVSK